MQFTAAYCSVLIACNAWTSSERQRVRVADGPAAAAERVAQSARDDIYPGNASEITVCTAAISAMDDHTPPGDTHGGHVEHAYAVSPPHFAFDDAFSDADDAEERLEFSPEAIREDIAKTFTNLDKHVAQDEAEDFARKIGRAVARAAHPGAAERGYIDNENAL
ncbi:hypothetical protein POSPLADRAFT_1051097 [Postia placenta MAD-698-R-SB12]|uniref:Uncharacterized protein n=1 Tax=Postia placenta MAD-698-R-SB12 TaxID=670580 RepID=A0A1X6NEB4_9APHY|nr:hypothetical protein POSPLADRAFT_1051097 [Postia placenta MAD-698-R-SB12]OSX66934.1 hypothetical protein POSPLADRAFT_1051097 [Postia placenta MAD-698-R-SB12]